MPSGERTPNGGEIRQRRVCWVVLTPEALILMLRGGRYVTNLPADAQFRAMYFDDVRSEFRVHIESASFPIRIEGLSIPRFDLHFNAVDDQTSNGVSSGF